MESHAQTAVSSSPISSSPIKTLALALTVTALALAGALWGAVASLSLIEEGARRQEQTDLLRDTIFGLDEILTTSAGMAAASGEPEREARYRRFEPELTTAIEQILALAPAGEARDFVASTDAANQALVAMENEAFELVRSNRADSARAVLESDAYRIQKAKYAQGMNDFIETLRDSLMENDQAAARRARSILLIFGAVLPLLFLPWFWAFRTMKRWRNELADVNVTLDRRVSERTEVLRASEERFRLLVESIPDCSIYLLGADGTVTTWNEGPGRSTGYTEQEIVGRHFCCFHSPEDVVAGLPERLLADARNRGGANVQAWIVRKDGSRFCADISLAATWDSNGGLSGFVTLVRDLTDRKRSDLLFRSAVDALPIGLLLVDGEGRITLVNRSLGRMFGYEEREMLGLSVDRLVPEKSLIEHVRQRGIYFEAPTPRQIVVGRDLRGRRRDGSEFPVEIGLNPLASDGIQFALVLVTDITERKRIEMSGRAREARLQALMENANDGITVLSPDGTIQEVNRRMEAVLGRPNPAIVGHHIMEFLLETDGEAVLQGFIATVAQGGGQVQGVEIVRPDRSIVVIDFSVSTVQIGDEQLVFSIARETTKERMLERQLLQAQRLESIGRLAGGVAHDFNNLLTVISGNAELVAEAMVPGDSSREDLSEILRAAERGGRLTQQLLAFSRQQVLDPKVLDVSRLVIGMEKMLDRIIGEDVRLEFCLDEHAGLIRADPGQVEQVVMNLVVNARDAVPSGGTITIETSTLVLDEAYAAEHEGATPGHHVMLSITDTGIGMTPDVQARIFDPFYTTKGVGKGTGLGLATVYGIVKQSGGHIWVYSEPGKGTRIKVFLPRVADLGEEIPVAPATETPSGGETVLVVEDDGSVRRITVGLLERKGYRVLVADGPQAALDLVANTLEPIDLLMTDVVMPTMSGPALARLLTSARPGLKVLYASGYTHSTIARHGLTEGEAFLQKPFTGDSLARKVRSVLNMAAPALAAH